MTIDDKQLEKTAKKAFDQQLESLDSQTLHHLRNARKEALAHDKRQPFKMAKWLTGAGAGLALAGLLTFMLAPSLLQSDQLSPLDDLEILTAEADLDLLTDLEFYEWLDVIPDES